MFLAGLEGLRRHPSKIIRGAQLIQELVHRCGVLLREMRQYHGPIGRLVHGQPGGEGHPTRAAGKALFGGHDSSTSKMVTHPIRWAMAAMVMGVPAWRAYIPGGRRVPPRAVTSTSVAFAISASSLRYRLPQ